MNKHEELNYQLTLPEEMGGMRLDQCLAQLIPDHSRTRIQNWIKAGWVSIENEPCVNIRHVVQGNENVVIAAQVTIQQDWAPTQLPIDIIYEDDDILVVNKAIGMVVHPAAGHQEDTLVNALLHYNPALSQLPRAGIVHRLDKDTSGLLIVAKSLFAHTQLVTLLQAREIDRIYEAIVIGHITSGGTIDEPMGRHPTQRIKMAVVANGKPATTHYRILHRFRAHTHLLLKLETGRTHQIRVHMAHIHHPIVGDQLYGGRPLFPKGCSETLRETISQFKHQALHAKQLNLIHPRTGEPMSWTAPLPEDMLQLIEQLQQDESEDA